MAAALLTIAASTKPLLAQQVTIRGSVVDEANGEGLGTATLKIGDRTLITDAAGRFRISGVMSGNYEIVVTALGYRPLSTTLAVHADTAVVFALTPAPIQLDPLTVQARHITVRGQLVEPDHGVGVIDTEVRMGSEKSRTDLLGRFRFSRVPAGVPTLLSAPAFGYLPVEIVVEADRDTTIKVVLAHDSVALRMIQEQLSLIDIRSEDRRYKHFGGLKRDDLLKGRNSGTFIDLLQNLAGTSVISRIGCIVIDEKEVYESGTRVQGRLFRRRAGRLELAPEVPPLLPDQIYHLELLALPEPSQPFVLRIYTRRYVQELVAGSGELIEKRLATARVGGRCR